MVKARYGWWFRADHTLNDFYDIDDQYLQDDVTTNAL